MTLRIIILCVTAAALAYVGAAGWARLDLDRTEAKLIQESKEKGTPVIYKGVTFADQRHLSQFLSQQMAEGFFPWIRFTPGVLAALLVGLTFGGLGGIGSVIARSFLKGESLGQMALGGMLLFGALVGVLFTFVSFITPDWLAKLTPEASRSAALAGLCFLGGVFPMVAYQSIEQYFKGVLPSANRGGAGDEGKKTPGGSAGGAPAADRNRGEAA